MYKEFMIADKEFWSKRGLLTVLFLVLFLVGHYFFIGLMSFRRVVVFSVGCYFSGGLLFFRWVVVLSGGLLSFRWVVVLSVGCCSFRWVRLCPMLFPVGCCSFRWVYSYLVPSVVGLFVSGAFSVRLLIFSVGMFVSDTLFCGFFRVWCLFW